jgi:hypothetical protein
MNQVVIDSVMKNIRWTTWLSILMIAATAGWMFFDGAHALITGTYVILQTGEFTGQLGPWANLVQSIGIDPNSIWLKLIFIMQGLGTLTVVVNFILNKPWAWTGLLIAMLLGLWYLPFGTLINLLALILLLLTRRNNMPPRPRFEMPDFIQTALHKRKLMDAYLARPPYQRNDYIGWITRARLTATRQKRLKQMLDELKKGNVYMKMEWTKNHTFLNKR